MVEIASPSESRSRRVLQQGLIIMAGIGLMTLAAKTQIPFWPVPMTLHTMAVMAFAAGLGPRLSLSIFLGYLLAGSLGLPVFSGTPERGIGLAYMMGPTGGYLAGFVVASWLAGVLVKGRGLIGRFLGMALALLPVYALGLAWLGLFVSGNKLLSLGLTPFLLGDLVKIAIVAISGSILPPLIAWLRRRSA